MKIRDLDPDTVVVTTRRTAHLRDDCWSLQKARSPRRKAAAAAHQDKKVCSRCSGEYSPRENTGGRGDRPHLLLEEITPEEAGLGMGEWP